MATLDKKESAFFSHYDPNIVEWFVKMVEERKKHHDSPRKRKHGKSGNREGERQAPFLFPPQVKKSVVSIRQFVDKTPADGI